MDGEGEEEKQRKNRFVLCSEAAGGGSARFRGLWHPVRRRSSKGGKAKHVVVKVATGVALGARHGTGGRVGITHAGKRKAPYPRQLA